MTTNEDTNTNINETTPSHCQREVPIMSGDAKRVAMRLLSSDLSSVDDSQMTRQQKYENVDNDDMIAIENSEDETKQLLMEIDKKGGSKRSTAAGCDVTAYMNDRVMTPKQEKCNAWTVVPNPIYCLYFILAGKWVSDQMLEDARVDFESYASNSPINNYNQWVKEFDPDYSILRMLGLSGQCVDIHWLPNFHALPPLPIIAISLGIILHAPASFLYHWYCAVKLPPGLARIEHWSRRLDHSMIHIASALISYGTSGRWDYFFVNAVFNMDCVYRQFTHRVHPKRNKIRILISMLAYSFPVLRRGQIDLFLKIWVVFIAAGWFFVKYPVKGWSHSVFHIIIAILPHLLMVSACTLAASHAQVLTAARCAVLKENS